VKAKYFQRNGGPFFSPLMTDQYAMFLYLLANTSFKAEKDPLLADRLYGLNKMLHSIDVYYQIELPGIFLFVHSVGTVLGRATYGDYLVVYQGVTVGGNLDYEYPIIHDGVALFSNSSVLGRSVLNRGVSVSARTFLMNTEVDENHICFGQHPHVEVKPARRSVTDHFFNTGKGNE
jgi:serine O-acetyltransferase